MFAEIPARAINDGGRFGCSPPYRCIHFNQDLGMVPDEERIQGGEKQNLKVHLEKQKRPKQRNATPGRAWSPCCSRYIRPQPPSIELEEGFAPASHDGYGGHGLLERWGCLKNIRRPPFFTIHLFKTSFHTSTCSLPSTPTLTLPPRPGA